MSRSRDRRSETDRGDMPPALRSLWRTVRFGYRAEPRMLAATRHCTTILVSHRFSTVRLADRICVVEGGRVIELGTHAELMALGGRYHTMYELQASRFVELDERGEEVEYERL